mmetsp:Transcript_16561/g.24910  ORF Transcript_16561/g.24910 Transcript_16561/m.24910 type:complete len:189 (+) Transcript_16561:78-644(+)
MSKPSESFERTKNEDGTTVVMVPIVPGIVVTTLYEDSDILLRSRFVIQAATTIFVCQILWGLLFLLATAHPNSGAFIFDFIITILISAFALYCAVTGVKYKNPVCCCGFGYLDFYATWCLVGAIFKTLYLIINIVVGDVFSIIFNAIFLMLYSIAYQRTRQLLALLNLSNQNATVNETMGGKNTETMV